MCAKLKPRRARKSLLFWEGAHRYQNNSKQVSLWYSAQVKQISWVRVLMKKNQLKTMRISKELSTCWEHWKVGQSRQQKWAAKEIFIQQLVNWDCHRPAKTAPKKRIQTCSRFNAGNSLTNRVQFSFVFVHKIPKNWLEDLIQQDNYFKL